MAGDTKVKLSTILGIIGGVGALLGIGAYLFDFGERLGRIETTLIRLEHDHEDAETAISEAKNMARADVTALADTARDRLREHERTMQKMSESIVALTTEVRIRSRDSSVVSKTIPVRVQESRAMKRVDTKLKTLKLDTAMEDPLAGLPFEP